MLPDRYRQLLTAYVDGELSSRQRRHVVRLLKRSGDARALLRSLQQDAAALGSLSTPKLDFDLSAAVLHKIRERRLTPIRRQLKPLAPAFPAWVGVAIAASVLCMIGLASYMGFAAFLARSPGSSTGEPLARQETPETKPEPTVPTPEIKPDVKREVAHQDNVPRTSEFVGPPAPLDVPPPTVVVKGPSDTELHGPPLPVPGNTEPSEALLDRAMERFRPEMATGAVKPVILKLHDLDQDATRKKLNDELAQDTGFRLELPCDNGTRSCDRLLAVCKEQKIAVLIDQKAQQRLKAPQVKTNYVLYLENVTPEELARLVEQLGADDKKAGAKKSTEARFDRLVVTRLTKRDYKELSDLLGIDPSKVEAPKATGPLGTDLRKPLSEQTADQVAKSLEGNKSAAPAAAQQALALAYNPVLPPKNSPEVKRFLDSRKPPLPGTVRAIIVLRSM